MNADLLSFELPELEQVLVMGSVNVRHKHFLPALQGHKVCPLLSEVAHQPSSRSQRDMLALIVAISQPSPQVASRSDLMPIGLRTRYLEG